VSEQLEFRRAIFEALDEELARDPDVVLFGEDVAAAGGVFAVTKGLAARYPERVFDTPISELALMGAAYGTAVNGMRPVLEIMFGDFLPLIMDGLVNQAAKFFYVSNGQGTCPLVIRSAVGGGVRFGAIHSQMPAAWFGAVPGIKIVAPATPASAKGLLLAAIRDPNPVLFLEHKHLYGLQGPAGDGAAIPLGQGSIVREGADLTIATAMKSVHEALAAAELLAPEGIDCEVIDLRTLRPLDIPLVVASVERTGRLLVVEEGPRTGGWAAELVAEVTERAISSLDDIWRLATADHPIPFSPALEDAFFVDAATIAASVRARS
jgi:acetoin:2,6-dichlorophenolindophenol oxidoreductase subunit beta